MANTMTNLIDTILVRGLVALRQNAIMPRLVNRGYEPTPGVKGSTVTIPIPSAITATDVTPGPTPPSNTDVTPGAATLTLDNWKFATFYLSDKDIQEISDRVDWIPVQATEAIKAIANAVDDDIFDQAVGVYGYGGVAGTTPFQADASAFLEARKAMRNQLCPMGNNEPLYCIINGDAEYYALGLRAFQDAAMRGQAGALQTGEIGNAFGFNWNVDQNVISQISGGATHWQVNDTGDTLAVGDKAVYVETDGAATNHFHLGDIITFAGDTQTYVVTGITGGDTPTALAIEPGLKKDPGDHAAITCKATHAMNLAFHRDAFALASRELSQVQIPGFANIDMGRSIVDPVTNLVLRLQVVRGWMQTIFVVDCLWGASLIRREYAARIAG